MRQFKLSAKETAPFENYARNILAEDACEVDNARKYFSASKAVFDKVAPAKLEATEFQQISNAYADIAGYTQLLQKVLEPYKGNVPDDTNSPAVPNNFNELVKQDFKIACRYNRHFGASKICIQKWGTKLPDYEQIVEKYDWVRIVFKNLVYLLEGLQ